MAVAVAVAVVVGESTIRYQGRAKGRLPGVAAGARRPKTPNTMPRGKRPKLFVFDLDVSPPPSTRYTSGRLD